MIALPARLKGPWNVFDPEKLDTLPTWIAVGFTSLTAVLTFFGIKEGVLDRLLRIAPTSALLVFCLVGAGTLLGVIAPTLNTQLPVPVIVVALAVALPAYLVREILPDLEATEIGGNNSDDVLNVVFWAAVIGTVLLGLLFAAKTVPAVAGLLLVGISLTSMGLYGAAKLSVQSKSYPENARVTSQVVTVEGQQVLRVSTKVGRREAGQDTVVSVQGRRNFVDDDAHLIGHVSLTPDAAGEIDATTDFPLSLARWSQVTVRLCEVKGTAALTTTEALCEEERDVLRFDGVADRGRVAGKLTTENQLGAAVATLTAAGLQPDARVEATVSRARGGRAAEVVTGVVTPSAAGDGSWSVPVPATAGDELTLRYRVCYTEACAEAKEQQAARLVMIAN